MCVPVHARGEEEDATVAQPTAERFSLGIVGSIPFRVVAMDRRGAAGLSARVYLPNTVRDGVGELLHHVAR